ncbi:DUF4434 family protein [Scandinavium sp. TWS1a]|uniref:DUF4434 family protein n=1 Tax=Scandinavium tedordense TaxID=2926521 RepID=UPI002166269B|nr:DUF4434 family protein [Scandinavium tedordense]MCS2169548.1 DUF4434 family protein [Scandinavium tedordense]
MKRRHFLLLLALFSPLACAMNAIFWQPQLRDNSIPPEQWRSLMQNVRQTGFDTLVLQWTRYGEAFSNGNELNLLQQRTTDARAAGLNVIIGLHADPDFFQRQKQTATALTNYLNRLRVADIQQAKKWSAYADGWYISAEIDDLNWRNPGARAQLRQWLSTTRTQLTTVDNKPVYISSFFAGNMTPESYGRMLAEIHQLGLQVWVQDGQGVNTLTRSERALYLDASAGCESLTPAQGIVYELFQTQPGKTFNTKALSSTELTTRLTQKTACDKDRIYFSLRYLPIAKGTLEN